LNVDADLCELEDGEGGGAVLGEHEAQQGVDLSVEAAVTQTQQETAQDCYILAATHTTLSPRPSRKLHRIATYLLQHTQHCHLDPAGNCTGLLHTCCNTHNIVTQTQQETAQDRYILAATHTTLSPRPSRKLHRIATYLLQYTQHCHLDPAGNCTGSLHTCCNTHNIVT